MAGRTRQNTEPSMEIGGFLKESTSQDENPPHSRHCSRLSLLVYSVSLTPTPKHRNVDHCAIRGLGTRRVACNSTVCTPRRLG